MYLLNAFSLNMLPDSAAGIKTIPISLKEARDIAISHSLISAVGHLETATVFARELGVDVPYNRIDVRLKPGDTAIVGQMRGARLPEGATTLPADATIQWFRVEILPGNTASPKRLRENFLHRFFRTVCKKEVITGIVVGSLALMFGHIFSLEIHEFIKEILCTFRFREIEYHNLFLIVIAWGCFVFFSLLSYYLYHNFTHMEVRFVKSSEKLPCRPCRIFFVSDDEKKKKQGGPRFETHETGNSYEIWDRQNDKHVRLKRSAPADLKTDADALDAAEIRWAWENILRGLCDRAEDLKKIHLICSELTLQRAEICKKIIEGYFSTSSGPTIEIYEKGIDFEDVKQVNDALKRIIDKETLEEGRSEKDISIDITGGQKINTLAAAAFTFHSDLVIQYVQTGRKKEAVLYDIVMRHPYENKE